ncbi:MAG: hypothetical protein LUF30_07635 [Lachnospiraceae bacterium]|nr:hypothetical protein [Lachnospiraceae bacterium]
MKDRKFRDRVITILEMALLAGMVLLSFYLLFCSVREGEQAVNGTAEGLVTGPSGKAVVPEDAETEDAEPDESERKETEAEATEPEGFEPEGAELGGAEADKAEMEGFEPDKSMLEAPELEASEKEVVEAGENESERGSDENGEAVNSDMELVYRLEEESPFIRVRILNSDYTEDCFDEIRIAGTVGFTAEWGTYGEDYRFLSTVGLERPGEANLSGSGDDEETALEKAALGEDEQEEMSTSDGRGSVVRLD